MDICVRSTKLRTVDKVGCPVKWDQIVKTVFQRGNAPQNFLDETEAKLFSNWLPLLTAADNTLLVPSPIFSGLVIPVSEGLYNAGGDNNTVDGVREYRGEGSVTVSGGNFKNISTTISDQLRSLSVESDPSLGADGLRVYLINRDGNIISKSDFSPIQIFNYRVSSTGSEGFAAPNVNNFDWEFPPLWDKDVIMWTPSFNARTALALP